MRTDTRGETATEALRREPWLRKQVRIHLFGRHRFAAANRPFEFSARPEALPQLCYLVLHRVGPLSRAALAFAL